MKPFRALVVEDSEDDTLFLLNELRRGGYEPVHVRVETAETMLAELQSRPWDIIYSDFSMPRFSAFGALELLHSTGLDIPFIIVSGTIGEDRAVTAMKAGAHDYILKDNLKRLVPATAREIKEAAIRRDRRLADEIILKFAYVDPVTDLPNRARFHQLIEEAIHNLHEPEDSIYLLLMDLDRFKDVNDTLGHDRGDVLLKQVSFRLKGVLGESDSIARIGGDEFGILLPHITSQEDLQSTIVKLFDALAPPFIIDEIPISVEASIGIAALPEHANSPNALLQLADIAMYRAKKLVSNYALYEPRFNLHSPEQLGLIAELREAIEQNHLVLHYQPKLDLKSARIIGLEALVRWNHPRLGIIFPDRFILAAEQTGLIAPLTRWVLTEALNFIKQLNALGSKIRVSVNLSARSLHDASLLKMITDVLSETGSNPEQLMLEITESAIVLDPESAEDTLIALSRLGLSLSIDDFGTGYTSLGSIKRLPINEIKIDRSFITNMLVDTKEAMIVRTVIELGHNLGLTVVAEGIENIEVFNALSELGCNELQGYYISKPLSRENLLEWFNSSSWKIGIAN